jgi:serine protease Do
VVAKGPADKAGLRPGDIIESVDADQVLESKDLLRDVLLKPVGAQVKLGVRRDGKVQSLTATMAQRPQDIDRAGGATGGEGSAQGQYGLELQALTPDIARELGYRGAGKVVVSGVRPGSPAEVAGIQRGDVIVEADRRSVNSPDDVARALDDGKALLRVDRGDKGSYFAVVTKE